MGFNVTALAQKARTQTLIVDSDLNMGQYDVLATDVKGNTAEFSEFVGGVGNFESGLISGGLDVGDILHAESSMQIDGDLVVEGAINNVNITSEGAITTAKSVTATGGFKGKGILTGVDLSSMTINVSPSTTLAPIVTCQNTDATGECYVPICPYCFGLKYSGTIKYKFWKSNSHSSSVGGRCAIHTRNTSGTITSTSILRNDTSSADQTFTIPADTTEVIIIGDELEGNNTSVYFQLYLPIFTS